MRIDRPFEREGGLSSPRTEPLDRLGQTQATYLYQVFVGDDRLRGEAASEPENHPRFSVTRRSRISGLPVR